MPPAAGRSAAARAQLALFVLALIVAAVAVGSFVLHFVPAGDRMVAGRGASFRADEAMLNQETGLRGYLATHDEQYLAPFVRGNAELAQANATLDDTIGAEASLAPLLLETRVAETRWIERWADAAQRMEGANDPAFLALGRELFDAYRAAEGALNAAIERRIATDDRVMRTVRGVTLSLLLALLGGVVLVAAHERRMRDSHEQRLLVLIRAAHEIAESLDERRIVRVLERASAGLTQGPEAQVVLATDPRAHADEAAARAMKAGQPVRASGHDDPSSAPLGAVPMMVGGRVVGALVTGAGKDEPDGPKSDPHTVALMEALANYGAAALESARLFRLAHEQGRVDALTHLFNRRRLDEDIADECRRSARYRRPLSLLMIDVDHFKAYNDAHGHAAGDEALKDVAALLRAGVRLIDSVYRFGGEEMAILLRETDIRGASVVAERLRAAIEAAGKVTASLGVAELDLKEPVPSAFIEAADRALYAAKHTGRNRISLAQREEQRQLGA